MPNNCTANDRSAPRLRTNSESRWRARGRRIYVVIHVLAFFGLAAATMLAAYLEPIAPTAFFRVPPWTLGLHVSLTVLVLFQAQFLAAWLMVGPSAWWLRVLTTLGAMPMLIAAPSVAMWPWVVMRPDDWPELISSTSPLQLGLWLVLIPFLATGVVLAPSTLGGVQFVPAAKQLS